MSAFAYVNSNTTGKAVVPGTPKTVQYFVMYYNMARTVCDAKTKNYSYDSICGQQSVTCIVDFSLSKPIPEMEHVVFSTVPTPYTTTTTHMDPMVHTTTTTTTSPTNPTGTIDNPFDYDKRRITYWINFGSVDPFTVKIPETGPIHDFIIDYSVRTVLKSSTSSNIETAWSKHKLVLHSRSPFYHGTRDFMRVFIEKTDCGHSKQIEREIDKITVVLKKNNNFC